MTDDDPWCESHGDGYCEESTDCGKCRACVKGEWCVRPVCVVCGKRIR